MLIIRPEQLDTFGEARFDGFRERTCSFLEANFSEEITNRKIDDLEAFFYQCTQVALDHGFDSEQEIVCIACVCLILNEDYANDPRWLPITEVLDNPLYEVEERVDLAMEIAVADSRSIC